MIADTYKLHPVLKFKNNLVNFFRSIGTVTEKNLSKKQAEEIQKLLVTEPAPKLSQNLAELFGFEYATDTIPNLLGDLKGNSMDYDDWLGAVIESEPVGLLKPAYDPKVLFNAVFVGLGNLLKNDSDRLFLYDGVLHRLQTITRVMLPDSKKRYGVNSPTISSLSDTIGDIYQNGIDLQTYADKLFTAMRVCEVGGKQLYARRKGNDFYLKVLLYATSEVERHALLDAVDQYFGDESQQVMENMKFNQDLEAKYLRLLNSLKLGSYLKDEESELVSWLHESILGEDVDGDYIHYVLDNFENYAKLPKQANEKFFEMFFDPGIEPEFWDNYVGYLEQDEVNKALAYLILRDENPEALEYEILENAIRNIYDPRLGFVLELPNYEGFADSLCQSYYAKSFTEVWDGAQPQLEGGIPDFNPGMITHYQEIENSVLANGIESEEFRSAMDALYGILVLGLNEQKIDNKVNRIWRNDQPEDMVNFINHLNAVKLFESYSVILNEENLFEMYARTEYIKVAAVEDSSFIEMVSNELVHDSRKSVIRQYLN
jgi:hypothetical protein